MPLRKTMSSDSVCRSASRMAMVEGDRIGRDGLARMFSVPWLRGSGAAEAVQEPRCRVCP